jgi:type VI protein secretion system component VasF
MTCVRGSREVVPMLATLPSAPTLLDTAAPPLYRSSSLDAAWSDEELDALAERVRAWLDEYARHLALKTVEPT